MTATKPKMTQEAARLLELLTYGEPHRQIYLAAGYPREWWMTYRGGRFTEAAVMELRDRKMINSVYSNCLDQAYHVGRTLDCERTDEARRKDGKHARKYYLGDPK